VFVQYNNILVYNTYQLSTYKESRDEINDVICQNTAEREREGEREFVCNSVHHAHILSSIQIHFVLCCSVYVCMCVRACMSQKMMRTSF
jgi:hypothetical protein